MKLAEKQTRLRKLTEEYERLESKLKISGRHKDLSDIESLMELENEG